MTQINFGVQWFAPVTPEERRLYDLRLQGIEIEWRDTHSFSNWFFRSKLVTTVYASLSSFPSVLTRKAITLQSLSPHTVPSHCAVFFIFAPEIRGFRLPNLFQSLRPLLCAPLVTRLNVTRPEKRVAMGHSRELCRCVYLDTTFSFYR